MKYNFSLFLGEDETLPVIEVFETDSGNLEFFGSGKKDLDETREIQIRNAINPLLQDIHTVVRIYIYQ